MADEEDERERTVLKYRILAVLLAAWVLIPHPLQGPVVAVLWPGHGIHLGDLAGLVVAGLVVWRWRRTQ